MCWVLPSSLGTPRSGPGEPATGCWLREKRGSCSWALVGVGRAAGSDVSSSEEGLSLQGAS